MWLMLDKIMRKMDIELDISVFVVVIRLHVDLHIFVHIKVEIIVLILISKVRDFTDIKSVVMVMMSWSSSLRFWLCIFMGSWSVSLWCNIILYTTCGTLLLSMMSPSVRSVVMHRLDIMVCMLSFLIHMQGRTNII